LQRIIIRITLLWLHDKISRVGLAFIWFLNSVYLEFTAYRALTSGVFRDGRTNIFKDL
jgi:hypothetical protein